MELFNRYHRILGSVDLFEGSVHWLYKFLMVLQLVLQNYLHQFREVEGCWVCGDVGFALLGGHLRALG